MATWVDPIPALKRRVGGEIVILMDGWSQTFAASFLELPQSRVSELRRGNVQNISLERLLQSLSRLGPEIQIKTARRGGRGAVHPHWKIDGRSNAGRPRRG